MKRLAAVAVAVGAVAYVTVLQPDAPMPPTSTNPYVYCVNVTERQCYVNGDVPDGAVIEWAGRSSDVPR